MQMRTQNKLLVYVLVVLIAMVFSLACAWAGEAQKIKISLCHIYVPGQFQHEIQFPRYFKMVEEETKGKYILDVKLYPAGTLLGGVEMYDGVVKGIVDIGVSVFAFTPGRFPVMVTLSQPGIAPPRNCNAAAHTAWEFYNKFKPKELDNTKVLYIYGVGNGWIHTKKPIRSVEDIKGLKTRGTGAMVPGIKALGGEAIGLPSTEVFLAAQRGVIEAAVFPLQPLEEYKLHEVFDYSTFIPGISSEFKFVAMNLDKWKSLPKDLQSAFDAVTEKALEEAGRIWQYYQTDHMIELIKTFPGGHQLLYLPDSEVAKVKELLRPIRNNYIATLKGKGLPGEEIVSEAAKIMEKYNERKYEPWRPPGK
jgi:TRAP-type C4-dicarboxylate transport system substrate-binding protein